ncbi:MAG TPA: KTSC domain-containing protein, partial [Terriglobales bacterium]
VREQARSCYPTLARHCFWGKKEMIDWIAVTDSTRVSAIRYDAESETIYVRFPDGVEWYYSGCPPHVWEEFTREGTSKGRYISQVLDGHPKGKCV